MAKNIVVFCKLCWYLHNVYTNVIICPTVGHVFLTLNTYPAALAIDTELAGSAVCHLHTHQGVWNRGTSVRPECSLSERSRCIDPQPCVKRQLLSTSAVFITLRCRNNSNNYFLSNWASLNKKVWWRGLHGKTWSPAKIPHSSKKAQTNKWLVQITSVLKQKTGMEVKQLLTVRSH